MNKKYTAIVCVLLVIVGVLFAVNVAKKEEAPKDSSSAYFTFTDSLGKEVVLEKKPERVAVLFSSLCNVWKNAGGETAITVGESVERGFCGEDVLLVDSGAGKTINNELLLSYEPDFVICSSDVAAQKETAAILENTSVPTASIRLDSFEDYLCALKIFCKITGNGNNYDIFGKNVEDYIKHYISRAEKSEKEPRVLFIRSGSTQSSCKAKKADDNFAAKILEDLGCVNIADSAPVLLDGISAEVVLKENPDYIFVSLMGDEKAGRDFVNSMFSSEVYSTLESKIVFLDKDLYQYKPCEKWAEAYFGIAQILYPALFIK